MCRSLLPAPLSSAGHWEVDRQLSETPSVVTLHPGHCAWLVTLRSGYSSLQRWIIERLGQNQGVQGLMALEKVKQRVGRLAVGAAGAVGLLIIGGGSASASIVYMPVAGHDVNTTNIHHNLSHNHNHNHNHNRNHNTNINVIVIEIAPTFGPPPPPARPATP